MCRPTIPKNHNCHCRSCTRKRIKNVTYPCFKSPTMAIFMTSIVRSEDENDVDEEGDADTIVEVPMRPHSDMIVYKSRSAWVGCSPLPSPKAKYSAHTITRTKQSPALITGQPGTYAASCATPPRISDRIAKQSQYLLSVTAVSEYDSPFCRLEFRSPCHIDKRMSKSGNVHTFVIDTTVPPRRCMAA